MTSKFSIDNRELLQRISSGEAVVGIDFGNLIVRELAAFRLAAMDSEPVAYMTYKGYLLHAGDPKLAEYSEPMPLYADPRPEPISAEPVAWLLSGGGAKNVVCFDSGNAYADPLREVTPLYRHAQPAPVSYSDFEEFWSAYIHPLAQDDELKDFAWDIWCAAMLNHPEQHLDMVDHSGDVNEKGGDGNSPVIPEGWQVEAEKLAEMHGMSFVLFRHGEAPQCADPTKVVISFTDKGLGHDTLPAAHQEVK